MLRQWLESDLPELVILETLCHAAPWSMEIFKSCWQAGYIAWVIEQESKAIGFILLSVQSNECHILNLCVHPSYQRQKWGEKLLENALITIKPKGVDIVYLEVRRSNHPAIRLYEKLGFVRIGERKDYYPGVKGREDALVFAKDLSVQ